MSGSFIVNENDYNIFIQNTDKDKMQFLKLMLRLFY